jgi:hypothetical protein
MAGLTPLAGGFSMDWHLTVRLVVAAIVLIYIASPLIGEWRRGSA